MIIWKNWPGGPKNWPLKRKNSTGNQIVVGLIKRKRSSGLDQITRCPAEVPKFPLLTTVRALNHWFPDTAIGFRYQYWWGKGNRATESAYLACPACSKHNSGRTALLPDPGRPDGPFHIWQMDLMPLPYLRDRNNILVMVCIFCHWTEAFPCRQATASSVAQILWERESLPGDPCQTSRRSGNPFYRSGASTKVRCVAGVTTLGTVRTVLSPQS